MTHNVWQALAESLVIETIMSIIGGSFAGCLYFYHVNVDLRLWKAKELLASFALLEMCSSFRFANASHTAFRFHILKVTMYIVFDLINGKLNVRPELGNCLRLPQNQCTGSARCCNPAAAPARDERCSSAQAHFR